MDLLYHKVDIPEKVLTKNGYITFCMSPALGLYASLEQTGDQHGVLIKTGDMLWAERPVFTGRVNVPIDTDNTHEEYWLGALVSMCLRVYQHMVDYLDNQDSDCSVDVALDQVLNNFNVRWFRAHQIIITARTFLKPILKNHTNAAINFSLKFLSNHKHGMMCNVISHVQHSCRPNCMLYVPSGYTIDNIKAKMLGNSHEIIDSVFKRTDVLGDMVYLFAVRDIKKGEKLTICYGEPMDMLWSNHDIIHDNLGVLYGTGSCIESCGKEMDIDVSTSLFMKALYLGVIHDYTMEQIRAFRNKFLDMYRTRGQFFLILFLFLATDVIQKHEGKQIDYEKWFDKHKCLPFLYRRYLHNLMEI